MIPIAFNVNKNYIPYLAVTIASILKNASQETEFDFYVLSTNNLEDELNKIAIDGYNNFNIINKIINTNIFDGITDKQIARHITFDGYLHAFIPKILTKLDKCIHLDCDLVVNADITNLYKHDLSDNYMCGAVSAVTNYVNYPASHAFNLIQKYNLVDGLYFNIGVKLLNLKQIRRDNAEDKFLNEIKNYIGNNDLTIFDQDLMNIVYQGMGKIRNIDPRWNVNINAGPYRPSKDCFVIHWPGKNKPWIEPTAPHVLVYLEYAKMTNFYDQIKQDLLKIINERLGYLETKLWYKKYKRKLALFDIKLFGKPVFPGKVAHYQRKIDKFLLQKREKERYYDELIRLKQFLA